MTEPKTAKDFTLKALELGHMLAAYQVGDVLPTALVAAYLLEIYQEGLHDQIVDYS